MTVNVAIDGFVMGLAWGFVAGLAVMAYVNR